MKKSMPMKKGVMPAGMYADGGKVKGKAYGGKETMAEEKAEMKKPVKMADGGMVGGGCGPGYVADWNRKDMRK